MSQMIETAGYRSLTNESRDDVGQQTSTSSTLSRFTSNLFSSSTQPSQYVVNKCTLVAARTTAIAVGMVGNVTFIPIIRKAAQGNEELEDVLITCSVLGFGVLTAWLLLRLVNQALQKQSPEEKQLFSGRLSSTTKKTVLATSVVVGLASQLPPAYMAYAYNEREAPIPIISASVLVISNFSQPAYSTKLSIESFLNWVQGSCRSTPFKIQLDNSRQRLIKILSVSLEEFLKQPPDQRATFLQDLDLITSAEVDNKTKASQILAHICSLLPSSVNVSDISSQTNWIKKVCSLTASSPFALSLLSLYWLGGYKPIYDFSSNEGGSATVATIVTACNTHLVFLALQTVIESVYNKGRELVAGELKSSLAFRISPMSTIASYITSVFFAAFCYPGAWQVSQDYYEGKGNWPTIVGAFSSVANCSLVTYALFTVTEEAVPLALSRFGNKEQKEIAKFSGQISKFIDVIRECPDEVFANFLLSLPNDEVLGSTNLFAKLQMNADGIESFLKSRSIEDLTVTEEEAINDADTSFRSYGSIENEKRTE